jgi:hypothetical protein
MKRQRSCSVIIGIGLVLTGTWFLLIQFFPDLNLGFDLEFTWPWLIIGLGLLMFVFGLVVDAPGMAVPAAIITGIGGILYYQVESGDWSSWGYLWTLIPGFVGIGILIMRFLQGEFRAGIADSLTLIIISLVLFMIFSSLLGGPLLLGPYWPVLIILFGVWLLVRAFIRPRRSR